MVKNNNHKKMLDYLPLVIAGFTCIGTLTGLTWQASEMKHTLILNNAAQDYRIESLENAQMRNQKFQDYVVTQLEKINDKLPARRG